MVVFATGVVPNVELAARAGLMVDRGIVVGDDMRAVGCEDVFALGDCIQHRGEVYGLVAPIFEQAAVLADRITRTDAGSAYRGSKRVTKLKVPGIELATMGSAEPEGDGDEVVRYVESGRGVYKRIVIRDGRIAGTILLGDVTKVASLTQAFDQGTPLPRERATLLFAIGGARDAGAAELPDGAQICNCNAVTKRDIVACVLAGERSLQGIARRTRAGTGCGSCRDEVLQIIRATPAPPALRAA
jgi:nitrite reductase (NADH) large subunit